MFGLFSKIFVFSFIIPILKCQRKLHVEILYESLCPDSLQFITQQLYPAYLELGPYIELKLTPFGKSASVSLGPEDQFICQHGPQECKGNKVQSCVLANLDDQAAQVQYIDCFMKVFKKGQKNPQEFGQQCSDSVGIAANQVSQCYSSKIGVELQLIAERDTLNYRPKFIPTIVYNGHFNQELQDESLRNFRGVICNLLGQNPPKPCLQY